MKDLNRLFKENKENSNNLKLLQLVTEDNRMSKRLFELIPLLIGNKDES